MSSRTKRNRKGQAWPTPRIPIEDAVRMAKRTADGARLPMSLHRTDDPDQQWDWTAEANDSKPREAAAVVLPSCWWD